MRSATREPTEGTYIGDPHRGPAQGTHTGDPHRGESPTEDPSSEGRATQETHTEHTQTPSMYLSRVIQIIARAGHLGRCRI